MLVTGGNGCKENARGSAIFTTSLFTGEYERWERSDVAGNIKPENMPEWAKKSVAEINEPKAKEIEKPSIKDKLEQGKLQQQKPKSVDKPKKTNALEIQRNEEI